MHRHTAGAHPADDESGPAGFTLLSVTSNQRDLLPRLRPGIVGRATGTPDTTGQLRAERLVRDRVYTLTYEGTDQAGNTATCAATVRVTLPGR